LQNSQEIEYRNCGNPPCALGMMVALRSPQSSITPRTVTGGSAMKKKVLTKLRVRHEILRMLDEHHRAAVVGGQVNCLPPTNPASSCTPLAPAPRGD
jgi:hypothetical protein